MPRVAATARRGDSKASLLLRQRDDAAVAALPPYYDTIFSLTPCLPCYASRLLQIVAADDCAAHKRQEAGAGGRRGRVYLLKE